jgi:uncharacterized protein with HEPN domain
MISPAPFARIFLGGKSGGLGNRLRHDYDSVDIARIWLLIERDLPPLKTACLGALRVLEGNGPTA